MGLFRSTSTPAAPQYGAPETALEPVEQTAPVVKNDAPVRSFAGHDSVLAEDQHFEGVLTGEGAVRIDGEFQGDVKLKGSVSVSMPGSMVGTIDANDVLISGTVKGDIIAHGKLRLTCTSVVKGNVQAEALAIEDGARFDGRSSMLAVEEQDAQPENPAFENLQFGKNYTPEADAQDAAEASDAGSTESSTEETAK